MSENPTHASGAQVGTDEAGTATPDGYNYDRFHLEAYLDRETMVPDVEPGDQAVDTTVYTLDGEAARLSELWAERPVVIEFGSITCPLFTYEGPPMERLAERYDSEVDFYVLYVREAHPGGNYPEHESMEAKLRAARDCRQAERVEHRTLLVDSLDGATHRAYGALPNSVYLVGTDGVVAFHADWNKEGIVEEPIRDLLDVGGRAGDLEEHQDVTFNFQKLTDPRKVLEALRVFRRAGLRSLLDFAVEFPRVLWSRYT